MANEAESRAAGTSVAPIGVEMVSKITDEVLKLQLPTSTRDAIVDHAEALILSLNQLIREELGADEDTVARDLTRKAYALLAAGPISEKTPCFSAYSYMREAASITRRLLWIWAERNGVQRP